MTSRTTADAEHWLNSHGIINYDDLIDRSFYLEGEDLKKRQFVISRSRAPIELYVDSDPSMCAWVFEEQGISAIMFMNPGYLSVERRPDAPKKVRTWNQIEESIDRVNTHKSREAAKPKDLEFWSD